MSKDKKAPKEPKKKKEKIIYVDDGSTVADMSGVRGKPPAKPRPRPMGRPEPVTRRGRIWQTYKDAVKSMIGPMLIFIGGMSVVFFLVWLILGFFA